MAQERGFGVPGDATYDDFMKNIGSNPGYGLKTKKDLNSTSIGAKPKTNLGSQLDALKKRRNMFGGNGQGVNLKDVFKKAFSS